MPKIARCYARLTIEQKEIGKQVQKVPTGGVLKTEEIEDGLPI